MALYPPAIKKLVPPGANDPRLDVVYGTIAHVAVTEAASLFDYFNGPSGGIESHFYIRRDGTVEQYRDTQYEADANYLGNSFIVGGRRAGFISFETQGMEFGEWTDQQVQAIKNLILWVNAVHGVPSRKAPAWNQPGHGYHRLFGEWNNPIHSCPGPDRVNQYERVIVPWLANPKPVAPPPAIVTPPALPDPEEEFFMSDIQRIRLGNMTLAKVGSRVYPIYTPAQDASLIKWMAYLDGKAPLTSLTSADALNVHSILG